VPRIRQLPQLFLRGALVQETIRHLTLEQQDVVTSMVSELSSSPILSGHKNGFINKLSETIGCDYSDDRSIAEQDYRIALWRATAHLLYHCDYTFKCKSCSASEYNSARGKSVLINRKLLICPACSSVAIDSPGSSNCQSGYLLTHRDFLDLCSDLSSQGLTAPTCTSCIEAIGGTKKIQDINKVLDDPDQLRKYFSEFLWNYLRQILKENKITRHAKLQQTISGAADRLTADVIAAILKNSRIDYTYDLSGPNDGFYVIDANLLSAPPELSLELQEVLLKSSASGVKIELDFDRIKIHDMGGDSPLIELDLSSTATVMVASNAGINEEDGDLLDQIPEEHVGENGTAALEQEERLLLVRKSLPEGDCRTVFDLLVGYAPIYNDFVASDTKRASGVPKNTDMANFLGCSTKEIKKHEQTIRLQCLAHGMVSE